MTEEKKLINEQTEETDYLFYDESKYNLYGNSKWDKIPVSIKIAGLKIWATGALCYFIHIGSGLFDPLDLLVIDILCLTLMIEYLINRIIFWMENEYQPTRHYAFFEKRTPYSIFINFLYVFIIMILIFISYIVIGYIIDGLGLNIIGDIDFGSSPLVFSLLFFSYDYIIIKIKNGLKKLRNKK